MKDHYEIHGYPKNPATEDSDEHQSFMCKNKREVVGMIKVLLDNFDCEYIAIFKVNDNKEVSEP